MIRVLLADDENLIREALAQMLDLEADIEVVAQAASGTEAVAAALQARPDIAVLDLQMPGLDGIAVAEALAESLPGCGCVIVTSHGRPGYLKRALASGVRGLPAEDHVGHHARRGGPQGARGRPTRRSGARRRGHRCR